MKRVVSFSINSDTEELHKDALIVYSRDQEHDVMDERSVGDF